MAYQDDALMWFANMRIVRALMERTDQEKGDREKTNERLNAYDSIIIISYRALHVCFKILGQAENLCN